MAQEQKRRPFDGGEGDEGEQDQGVVTVVPDVSAVVDALAKAQVTAAAGTQTQVPKPKTTVKRKRRSCCCCG